MFYETEWICFTCALVSSLNEDEPIEQYDRNNILSHYSFSFALQMWIDFLFKKKKKYVHASHLIFPCGNTFSEK